MQIRRIYTGNALRNYDFRLDFPTGEVVIIDPSDMKIVNSLERCDAILLTHDHFDHVVGVEELIDRYDPSIFSHKGVQKYSNKQTFFSGDEEFDLFGEKFEVIYIPGHKSTHIGFLNENYKAAFLGDTIFNGGVGNTRDGDVYELFATITFLKSFLKDDFVIYTEHDYWQTNMKFTLALDASNKDAKEHLERYQSSEFAINGDYQAVTWGNEKAYNLFLRTHEPEVQSILKSKLKLSQDASEQDIFVSLREMRNKW